VNACISNLQNHHLHLKFELWCRVEMLQQYALSSGGINRLHTMYQLPSNEETIVWSSTKDTSLVKLLVTAKKEKDVWLFENSKDPAKEFLVLETEPLNPTTNMTMDFEPVIPLVYVSHHVVCLFFLFSVISLFRHSHLSFMNSEARAKQQDVRSVLWAFLVQFGGVIDVMADYLRISFPLKTTLALYPNNVFGLIRHYQQDFDQLLLCLSVATKTEQPFSTQRKFFYSH
jgi:hypothetical protein